MDLRKLLTIYGVILLVAGCKSAAPPPTGLDSTHQANASLWPRTAVASRDLDLPIYQLDTRRGALVPSGDRFHAQPDDAFTTFASGQFSSTDPISYWVQIDLDFPQYLIVSAADVWLAESLLPVQPSYVAAVQSACPLLYHRFSLRLAPLGTVTAGSLLYLFTDPYNPSSFLPPVEHGHYAEPLINVTYFTPKGQPVMGFMSSLCLSTPTPWADTRGEQIRLDQLGAASVFRDRTVETLRLTVPENLASSQREQLRLAHEPCDEILRDIPDTVDAIEHNPAGDELPTAVVFLCAGPTGEPTDPLQYKMVPSTIEAELTMRQTQAVALLVINLSPGNPATGSEQSMVFGGYSYNDVHRTSEMVAIPAFDGTFGEIAHGVYRVHAGIRNAIWLIISSSESGNINRFRYTTGALNDSVQNGESYSEAPWWDPAASTTGRIVHD